MKSFGSRKSEQAANSVTLLSDVVMYIPRLILKLINYT